MILPLTWRTLTRRPGHPRWIVRHLSIRTGLLLVLVSAILSSGVWAADISGFVRDSSNGESLPFVNVYLKSQDRGSASNESGYYVITAISPGSYLIEASAVGYGRLQRQIRIDTTDLILDLELTEETIELRATVVEADRQETETFDISPGRTVLQARELKMAPAAIEADPIRTIQTLPGVATLSDFSVGLYVRGGTPDQNLVLLDGTDVYNASHLFGLFSTFPADAAKSTEFLRGGYPAKYGGRLSSVLNVITDEGNKEQFEAHGGVSLLASRLTVQGPAAKGSYLMAIAKKKLDGTKRLSYNFYDLQGKTHQILSHDHLTIAAYTGQDNLLYRFDELDFDLEWGNRTISSKWTHVFDSAVFGNFMITGSRFEANTRFASEDVTLIESNRLTDLSFKGDVSYFPSNQHSVEVGLLVKRMSMAYDFGESDRSWFNIDVEGFHNALYVQDNWSPSRRLTLQPGLRLNQFSNGGYSGFSPRLAARYRVGIDSYLKAAVGQYHQYIFRLSREFQSIALLSNVWALADSTAEPSKSRHFVGGLETRWSEIDIDAEAYYKDYDELYELNYDEQESTKIGDILRRGNGEAYGFDVLLKKRSGRHTGWLSVTTGISRRKVAELNRDDQGVEQSYNSKFHRDLILNLVSSWRFAQRWHLNSRGTYGSGQPYTQILGQGEILLPSGERQYFEQRGPLNDVRLPSYQRLDLAVQWQRDYTSWGLKIYLQVVNVMNHENIFNYYYTDGSIEERRPGKRKSISMLPGPLPSFGFDFEF